eukprot:m.137978 g.137978  ORF g.137978 m.137978 type:complete len:50 (+) comp13151_c1_seq2:347-496(+)
MKQEINAHRMKQSNHYKNEIIQKSFAHTCNFAMRLKKSSPQSIMYFHLQ